MIGWLLVMAGCINVPESVKLSGTVFDDAYGEGSPVAGVTVTARGGDFQVYSEAVTAEDGTFSMGIASVQALFLELSGEGWAPTLFSGEAGLYDMEVTDGTLWVRSEDVPASLTDTFGSCAAVAGEGGVVEGEVRVFLDGLDLANMPLVETARVRLLDEAGLIHDACYLDVDATADADATVTGPLGRFGIFGVPEGYSVVEVTYGSAVEEEVPSWAWYYPIYMVEGGLSPFYPMLVEYME